MPREQINPNASQRLLEVYTDFSGGLNSEISNERLKDSEFPTFNNVDLSGRASARRRYGRLNVLTSTPSGLGQGLFFYFRAGQSNPDVILAVNGQLYLMPATLPTVTNETPTGAVNGTNTTFTLSKKWIQRGSVVFRVNGVAQTLLDNPILPPTVSVINGVNNGGVNYLALGMYSIGITFTNALGETQVSPVAQIMINAPYQTIGIVAPTLPQGATGYNIYMSVVPDSSTLGKVNSSPLTSGYNIAQNIGTSAPQPPSTNTGTQYTVDYANGVITTIVAPTTGQTVVDSYTYELTPLPITGLSGGFQTTLMIEAVMYKGKLYIATGTNLVVYDGTTAATITPYVPTPLEAIYIGTNALMSNPNAYLVNGTQASGISAIGLQPSTYQAVSNQPLTFTGFYNKAASITSVQYQFQYKKSSDSTWTLAQDWSTTSSFSFTPNMPVPYDIMLTVRDANNTSTVSLPYIITQFQIYNQAPPAALPSSAINSCTKIMLYWDRILLTKDSTNPFQIYISDLANPAYFPTTNSMSFDNGKQEPVTAIVKFRSYLFVFTKTSIFTVQGKAPTGPNAYTTNLIHDVYGCIADRSVQVVKNQILFLSNEGLMELTPNMFFTSFDVKRMDMNMRSAVPNDPLCCSVLYDNMYWVCFPSTSTIYRMYPDLGNVWVQDVSSKLNLSQFLKYGSTIYNLTQDGKVWQHSKNAFDDCGEVYNMYVESKYHDFSSHMNNKKMKRIFVLAKHYSDHNVDLSVTVMADASILLNPDASHAYVDANGNTQWMMMTAPNVHYYSGTTLGNWLLGVSSLGTQALSVQRASISGKGRRIKVIFQHQQPYACEIYGYGFEFRLKRP